MGVQGHGEENRKSPRNWQSNFGVYRFDTQNLHDPKYLAP